MASLVDSLVDPSAPNFHQWLTPEQFTGAFGPTEEEYAKVIKFLEGHGMKVASTHPNRMIVDVTGSAAQIETAFNVGLSVYQHPTEDRLFFAPDAEPSVPAGLPILHIAGLENYNLPRPLLKFPGTDPAKPDAVAFPTGSGPGGDYTGRDFRAAYAPGVTNTGAGQYVAIVDVGGPYYAYDIYRYETNAGFSTNIPIRNILLTGWTGVPTGPNQDDGEETLDIDMALSMAPGATILNYEGEAHDVFNRIATDNLAKQITMSYGFGIDASIQQMFMEFIVQGQAFFEASGDSGADVPGGTGLTGEPYATEVGGTDLNTSGPGGAWVSETGWVGSGGGSSAYGMPAWQEGVNTVLNQGSPTNRNYPDVSALANPTIWWYFKNGTGSTVGGTSASSPQWAGFLALVNQAAAAQGLPPVGFINPIVYSIGKNGRFSSTFHDITAGNNFNTQSPSRYAAMSGYDLVTGWGSPRGLATIDAFISYGATNFTIQPTVSQLNIVQGCTATTVIQIVPMNRFKGSVALSISGLPAGVTASFSSQSVTTNLSILTVTTSSQANYGSTNLILTAVSGSLTNTYQFPLVVVPPIPGATPVSLAGKFNRAGIYRDASSFTSGIDGSGSAYSATLLGAAPSAGNVPFTLGPANASDAISCGGQVISLPGGKFTTLQLLGAAVNGGQLNQGLVVTYGDGTTEVLHQSFSDWFGPQSFPGESIAFAWPYRNISNGTRDLRTFNLYSYSLTIDPTRTVASLTLPHDANVVVLAVTLANAPAAVPLTSLYNRHGMYNDGTTFTNPATGGIDGSGDAYSASALGSEVVWNGTEFALGPANALNVVSCTGQVVTVPAGEYHALKMLATGVNGRHPSQTFVLTYADGSSSNIVQSLSDWLSPQAYPNETKALITGYRDFSDGSQLLGTAYLYGYSFNLDATKTLTSITLPNNALVILAAFTLVPNWPPTFTSTTLTGPDATPGQPYTATLGGAVNDLNNDAVTIAKISGPDWLSVSSNGGLSGTPLSADAGPNSFTVSVTDIFNLTSTATLKINVVAPLPIDSTVTLVGANLLMQWSGGLAPYQLQMSTNLTSTNWVDVGGPISTNSVLLTPTNADVFYRVIGQ